MLNTPRITLSAMTLTAVLVAASGQAETLNVPSQYSTIDAAIDAAQDGDVISVAPGHYDTNADFGGKAIILQSTHGSDSTFLYPKTINEPIVNLRGPLEGRAVLTGFTLSQGNATNGGAMFVSGNALVANSVFENNSADLGGAAFISGNVTFRNVDFRNNSAMHGGAIYAGPLAVLTVDRSELDTNEAQIGGAIYSNATNFGGEITLVLNSTLENNFADDGGAIYSLMRSLSVEGSELLNNDALNFGGSVLMNNSAGFFFDTVFTSNNADSSGGAIAGIEFSAIMAEQCSFEDNFASSGGALFASSNTEFQLLDSMLSGNSGPNLVNIIDAGGNTFGTQTERCMADMDDNGEVSAPDFSAWLNAFYARDPRADQNEDGFVNGMDFGAFLRNFNAGCN